MVSFYRNSTMQSQKQPSFEFLNSIIDIHITLKFFIKLTTPFKHLKNIKKKLKNYKKKGQYHI